MAFQMNKQRERHMSEGGHESGHSLPHIHIHSHENGHTVHIMHPDGRHEKHEHDHGDAEGIAQHIHDHLGAQGEQRPGEENMGESEGQNESLPGSF